MLKPPQLVAKWYRARKDIMIIAPTKEDAHLLEDIFKARLPNGRNFLQELTLRGYDMSSFKFVVNKGARKDVN